MTQAYPTELKQKCFTERREFRLEPDRIRIFTKDDGGEIEAFVDYEDVTSRTRHVTEQSGRLYRIAVSFGVFSIVGLVANYAGVTSVMRWVPLWIIATAIFFAIHLVKRRRYLLLDLKNGRSIFFLHSRPSEKQLANFLEAIQAARKQYLRDAYYKTGASEDLQRELATLKWLLGEGAITEVEFKVARQHLEDGNAEDQAAPGNKPIVN